MCIGTNPQTRASHHISSDASRVTQFNDSAPALPSCRRSGGGGQHDYRSRASVCVCVRERERECVSVCVRVRACTEGGSACVRRVRLAPQGWSAGVARTAGGAHTAGRAHTVCSLLRAAGGRLCAAAAHHAIAAGRSRCRGGSLCRRHTHTRAHTQRSVPPRTSGGRQWCAPHRAVRTPCARQTTRTVLTNTPQR